MIMKKNHVSVQQLLLLTGVTEFGSGLFPYLTNLSKGRNATARSWLFEHRSANSVLQEWIGLMTAANNKSPYSEEFNEFDLKQVEKFCPQGEIPAIDSKSCWAVMEPLYSSSEYDSPTRLKEWFPKAEEFGRLIFGRKTMRMSPLSSKSVVERMRRQHKLATNSGFPRFGRRSKMVTSEIQDADSLVAYGFPAIVLFRNHYGKLRPVWMFPMAMNIIEDTFAMPIQDCIATSPVQWVRDYCTPWLGFEPVKRVLTQQWPQSSAIVGGDTTAMDAHMRPAQIQLVFEIVKWLFQPVFWEELHHTLTHVNDIDLLYGYDVDTRTVTKLEGIHGLASGSGWTQLSETVLQLFMAYINGTQGQGIGDDFYWVPGMSADEVVDKLEKFGLPANPAKQNVGTDDLTFLQRYFHQGFFSREDGTVFGAYYPTIRALDSMIYPERFHDPKMWNSDMFCTRNFMILENCVDDPCFDEFVKFVVRGHRDMIPFAKQNDSKLDYIQRASRDLPGLIPSYNQEKRDKPLSSFLSIMVARNL